MLFLKRPSKNDIDLKKFVVISVRIFIKMSSEWTDFPSEFNLSRYQANKEGQIRNKVSKYVLSPKPRKDTGYIEVNLLKDGSKDKKFTSYRIHNLLAKLF